MRITGVHTRLLNADCLIELTTDEDLVGIAVARHDVRGQIGDLVSELLVGEDPRCAAALWQKMRNARDRTGSGLLNIAAATLDIALWDLKAKANGEPLWRTLGASLPKVNVHASTRDLQPGDDAVRDWCLSAVRDFGFRAVQLKAGSDPEADLRHLGLVRDALLAVTREPALMIEAGERWTSKEAVRRIRELEARFDLTWVEAPTRCHDFLGLKRISEAIRSAVCVGRHFEGCADLLPHLHHRSLDVVAIDPGRVGITGALQMADAAFGFELPVALCDSPGNINAHVAAAMPYVMSMEVAFPTATDRLITSDVRIEQGWAITGGRAGNGLVVNREPQTGE